MKIFLKCLLQKNHIYFIFMESHLAQLLAYNEEKNHLSALYWELKPIHTYVEWVAQTNAIDYMQICETESESDWFMNTSWIQYYRYSFFHLWE